MTQELKSNLQPNTNDTLTRYLETSTVWLCIAKSGFTDSFLPTVQSHIGALLGLWGHWGALIRVGVVSNCWQCPSQSILWVVYISVIYWGDSTTLCILMAGIAHFRLATHPTTPPHHPPYCSPLTHDIHDITGAVKNYLKIQQ